MALIHFGVAEDVERHLEELRRRLREWAARVRDRREPGGVRGRGDRPPRRGRAPRTSRRCPFWQSYAGLKRYWNKRAD